jgi:alpha-galactosidase
LGILKRTDEVWPSDNTDALDRLTLQDGFSHAYTPGIMMAWVTDVPSGIDHRVVPLKFRFMVAMSGSLALGGNLNKYSAEDLEASTRFVSFYKRIRPTVQRGALYRLIAPQGSEVSATEYVSQDSRQAVLFAYLHSQQFGTPFPTVFLRGLEEAALYKVEAIDPGQVEDVGTVSGAYLMHHGIGLNLHSDYDSTAVILEKQ